jgi:hypothetical protein
MKFNSKKIIPLSVVFISALLLAACQNPENIPTPETENAVTPADSASGNTTNSETFATELRTTGTYESPAGSEEVGFVVFVDESGVITKAEAEVLAQNPTSKFRQTSFAGEFSDALVGKNINQLENVDRIGGSSLTTASFNKALPELKSQI